MFLRLRKAVRRRGQRVFSIAALLSPGLVKLSGQLLTARPGEEAVALTALTAGSAGKGADPWAEVGQALSAPGAVILAGERLAEVPGALAAAARLAVASGARLAWIPRRAGERGAIEAGACPDCCLSAAR